LTTLSEHHGSTWLWTKAGGSTITISLSRRGMVERLVRKITSKTQYMAEAQRLSLTGSWHFNVRTGEVVWSHDFFCDFWF
jgi:hypothetical protein